MTMGVTVSPILMNSEIPVLHFSILAHSIQRMPASAPVMVMFAPRLLPMTSEYAIARAISGVMAMLDVMGTIMAVMGMLLTTLHMKAEAMDMKNVAYTGFWPTMERMKLPMTALTPLTSRPFTTMNREMTNT